MKYLLRIWIGFAAGMACLVATSRAEAPAAPESGWNALPAILEQIVAPQFPDADFLITDFGAVSDNQSDCLPALNEAIEACARDGGGRVVVPAGDWLVCGPIHLKSNVNLHLEQDALVRFSTSPQDYLPAVLTRFEGTELMNYSPLIYAYKQENIAVTGAGTFDGQASSSVWWNWKGHHAESSEGGWKPGDPDQSKDVKKLCELADEGVPAAQRIFGQNHFLRPNFIQPYRCRNVLIEGVTFVNSPMWNVHPVLSSNVVVRGISVNSHGPNNDGCDPECCRNVLIEECEFDTGDDCIAIKSGRNADGRRIGVPSENIIVRNCNMKDGHGGVVLGSEMSGGVRNVFVENCRMDSPRLERAIRLKSNSLRGGYLENLCVRNLEVGQVSDAVVRINLEYWGETGDYPPTVRNVFLENIASQRSTHALYLVGLPQRPIENVFFTNCTFRHAAKPNIIEHVREIQFLNVSQPR